MPALRVGISRRSAAEVVGPTGARDARRGELLSTLREGESP